MEHAQSRLTNAQVRDIEALLHPYTNAVTHRQVGAHLIEKGEGVFVYDDQGNRFIEGMAGLWCAGLGFGDAELIDAAKAQLDKLPYYHLFGGRTHEPAIELAEKIKDLYPVPMARVFYCSSGSEANDTQVKLAWYAMNAMGKPEKKKIISRRKGYHGVTLVAASMTGLPVNHGSFDLPFDFVKHTTTPHYWREGRDGETEEEFSARLAQGLEDMILAEGPETVAAFIAEPVMGAGGVIVPPKGYFEAIGPVLAKYDVLMIADEVICGFGRTGNWWGSETFGIEPDLMPIAKGLTSGYIPMGGVFISDRVAGPVMEHGGEFIHGYTYSGHPAACAAGLENLRIMQEEQLVDRARDQIGPHLKSRWMTLADHPLVGEARMTGMIGALELVADKTTMARFPDEGSTGTRARDISVANGLVMRAVRDTMLISPPLILTEDEADTLVDRARQTLDQLAAEIL